MNKLVKNGMVAVIISPGYGAGWLTWNGTHDYTDMLFDPGLADLILNNATKDKLLSYATLKWPDASLLGIDKLTVEWIPQGTAFRINEYDGNESIEIRDKINWHIA